MHKRWWLLVGALALFCGGPGRQTMAEKAAGSRWLSDWEEGRRAARQSGRPIFVVFRCEN